MGKYLDDEEQWAKFERTRRLPGRSYMPALPKEPVKFPLQYLSSWAKASRQYPGSVAEVIEQGRNYWWTQQYYTGLLAWVVFLATEGQNLWLSCLRRS